MMLCRKIGKLFDLLLSQIMCVNSLSFRLQITARQWVVFAHKSPKDAEYLLEFLNKGAFQLIY